MDCVKLAVAEVFGEDNLPDLLVSGINHGSNASINVIYSGTMSAAVEGAMCGIPSIGFSLLDERWDADFRASVNVAKTMAAAVLEKGLPAGTCLNVNIPKVEPEGLKGIRICRQAMGHWRDTFDERSTPGGSPYYWMRGEFQNPDKGEDTDIHVIQRSVLWLYLNELLLLTSQLPFFYRLHNILFFVFPLLFVFVCFY